MFINVYLSLWFMSLAGTHLVFKSRQSPVDVKKRHHLQKRWGLQIVTQTVNLCCASSHPSHTTTVFLGETIAKQTSYCVHSWAEITKFPKPWRKNLPPCDGKVTSDETMTQWQEGRDNMKRGMGGWVMKGALSVGGKVGVWENDLLTSHWLL